MRRIPLLIISSAIVLTACGGGSDEATESIPTAETESGTVATDPAPVETATAVTEATTAVTETAPAVTETATTEPAAEPSDPSGAVGVTMVEWAVEAPTEIAAGTVIFDVSNGGSFAHHLAIARGNSYEDLPQLAGGAVDEATLGTDFLGRTANLQSDETATISFDLTPGNYVLFCNIAGVASHAAQGQVLAITVS